MFSALSANDDPMLDPFRDAFEALTNIAEGILLTHTGITRLADALLTARDDHQALHEIVSRLEGTVKEQATQLAALRDRFAGERRS
jgi:hypothetical protein